MKKIHLSISLAFALGFFASIGRAQQGYEFEVYDTHLTKPGATELELNANFVASGPKAPNAELFPTQHMVRSSLEIGTGLTSWLEGSLYVLAAHRPGAASAYVGNRLRFTAAAPASWNLPVEVGLTQELGYARSGFAEHRWTYELSPMIGKTWKSFAIAFNPALEQSLANGAERELEFEPKGRMGFMFGDDASISLEYYTTLGPTAHLDPRSEQQHQLFAAFETELSPRFEFAASVGRGLTPSSDRTVIATRLEYVFGR
jgi:hypothetical protein